jgi:hypothetical protein
MKPTIYSTKLRQEERKGNYTPVKPAFNEITDFITKYKKLS